MLRKRYGDKAKHRAQPYPAKQIPDQARQSIWRSALEPSDPQVGIALVKVLRGHKDVIGRIAWSPDGRLIASPSKDTTFRVWDLRKRAAQQKIIEHTGGVRAAAFDRTGRWLATGGDDGWIKIWETETWRLVDELEMLGCMSISFSPQDDILAATGYTRAKIFDVATGRALLQIPGHSDYVLASAFDPTGSVLAVAGSARDIEVWDVGSRRMRHRLRGHRDSTLSVAFAPAGGLLASGSADRSIKLWDYQAGNLIGTLEGHTGDVGGLAFLADGRLLASKSRDGTVRLWDCASWEEVRRIPEPGQGNWVPGIAFHPQLPVLATVGSEQFSTADNVVHLWQLDPDLMLGQPRAASVAYTSAKIVLVGESGAGKTGLAYRLATGTFKDHPSTHGQQFWLLDELRATRDDGVECEAILWDLAGQPDYRIVHTLFLDDADVALIVFDPTRDDDPLQGVDYWLGQLSAGGSRTEAGTSREVILVAARSDRGSGRLSEEEIARFCAERGITARIATSALSGDGICDLVALMSAAVNWNARPPTVTTATFQWIKASVLALKEGMPAARVILSPAELGDQLTGEDPGREFTAAELLTAVGHLRNHGYVALLRTSKGESRILLAPDLLNNVAASIVLEARRNPKGLGSLEERAVLAGDYGFPELAGLAKADRDVLLDSAIAMFLAHNVCFRETDPLSSRAYLVFPELINLKQPSVKNPRPVDDAMAYTVGGAIENVYASLVVLLGFTDVFTRTSQWRNQAEYVFGADLTCGFRLEAERDDELDFVIYFGRDVGESTRTLFQSLFESFLRHRDLSVRRFEPVTCGNGHQLNRAAVREQLTAGADQVFCMKCGERVMLPMADAPIRLTCDQAAQVVSQRQTVTARARFEQALFRLKAYVLRDSRAEVTCFISYAWGDAAQERWVERELATDLAKAGMAVLLDKWHAGIGTSMPRFVERVHSVDRVVVVGTPRYLAKYANELPMGGYVVAAEGDLIGRRMIGTEELKKSVLPILVEGTDQTALPPLLQGRVYCDFRQPEQYFSSALELILQLHGITPQEPISVELRQTISATLD
jgi:WD40 repeat protein